MTARYGVEHPLIPQPDPTFVWTEPARDVAEAVEHNERVFLYGPSGTGKSALVRQIAAVVKRPVRRVSLNGETSVADFIGHWTVNGNKETVFVKGILPQAMQEGYILQMDEVDAMQPEVGFILQQILEPHGHLLLTDTGEDIIPAPGLPAGGHGQHPGLRLGLRPVRQRHARPELQLAGPLGRGRPHRLPAGR